MIKTTLINIDPVKEQIKQKLIEKYDNTIYLNVSSIDLKLDITEVLKEYTERNNIDTPKIYITPEAYAKMRKLVDATSTEVGWYGTVQQMPGLNRTYLINDIIVYPQIVAGATCEQDEDKMFEFEMSLTTEQVNTKRFQGHSHVNMGVGPSAVDEQFYQDLLTQVTDYFIICVTNKRNEYTVRFYDVENNLLYSGLDIEVITDSGTTMEDWYTDMRNNLRNRTYTLPANPINNKDDDDFYDSYLFSSQYYKAANKQKYKRGK